MQVRTTLSTLLSAAALAMSACATPSVQDGSTAIQRLVAERSSAPAISSSKDPARIVAALTSRPLTADAAVEAAMLNNPRFQGALAEAGIARANLIDAGLIGNPVLSAKTRVPSGSGAANLEFGLAENLLDILMLPGRKRVAALEYESAESNAADAVLNLSREVRSAWIQLSGLQQLEALDAQIDEAAQAAVELAKRQQAAGTANELFVKDQEALGQEIDLERSKTQAETGAARQRLNQLLGFADDDRRWSIAGDLPLPPATDPDASALTSRALEMRLDLVAARQHEKALSEALAIKQHWRWIPLLNVDVSAERDTSGEWVVGPSVEFALPFFNRGQAGLARLEAQDRRSRLQVAELETSIPADVRMQSARVAFERELAGRYQSEIVPLRSTIVDLTQAQYNFMLMDVYRLLEAKRAEIAADRDAIAAVRDYWIARVDLDRAAGAALDLGPAQTAKPPQPKPMDMPMQMPMQMPMTMPMPAAPNSRP